MECQVGNRRVDIEVHKFPVVKKGHVSMNTICNIFSVKDTGKKGFARRGDQLGSGKAYQSTVDHYDKWTGKKWALTRALEVTECFKGRENKPERTEIWEFFKAKFGGKKFKS